MEERFYCNGCTLCSLGAKAVLFISGICEKDCFYCPISPDRKKDIIFINERPVGKDADIFLEIDRQDALGCSITGGEPLLHMEKVLYYIRILKERYGKEFHIHLYTAESDKEKIRKLHDAGLDEIRFHFSDPEPAARFSDWKVGIEIPAIPGESWEKKTIAYLRRYERHVSFINLNELEFSDTNFERMKGQNIFQKDDYDFAARSSKEFAERLISEPWSALIRFCSVSFKTDVQMRERFRRTSNNIRKDWEKVSGAGTLIKGFVKVKPKVGKKIDGGWETSEEEARRLGGKVIEFLPIWNEQVVEMEKV